jgi:hypothetical protein
MSIFEESNPHALELPSEIHSPTKAASDFTDEDRLRLLQLMTRRAMAERRGRAAVRERDDLETDVREPIADVSLRGEASPMTVAIAPRWRLVPEGTSLYDWQRDALPLWLSEGREEGRRVRLA